MNNDCKLVSRERHPSASVVRVGDAAFGGEAIPVIAGPCSVETNPQMAAAADAVAAAGATLMRGGAFKPRTSPYAFQGNGVEGLAMLKDSAYGLGGSVWTADPAHGLEVARRIRTGTIGINKYAPEFTAPFGGYKMSGFGRELGEEGLKAYTETKTVTVAL